MPRASAHSSKTTGSMPGGSAAATAESSRSRREAFEAVRKSDDASVRALRVSRTRMPRGHHLNRALRAGALLALLLPAPVQGQQPADPAAGLARAASEAESRLAADDLKEAERLYGEALFEGQLLLGTLERLNGRYEAARQALARAAAHVPDDPKAALALASEQLQAGDAAQAVAVLEAMGGAVRDLETTRVLARAYASANQPEAALRTLQQ